MRLAFIFFILFICSSVQAEKYCFPKVNFNTMPTVNSKTIKVGDNAELKISQTMATMTVAGAKIVSNIICQRMSGIAYTGSQQEWMNFINNNVQTLLKMGHKNIEFTLFGENDRVYQGKLQAVEYQFSTIYKKAPQIIRNLAVLDKERNIVANFAVSGNKVAQGNIDKEFLRLVAQVK